MKLHGLFLMALAAALPFQSWSATGAASAAPPVFVVPPDIKLSQPARDVVKMTSAGVPDEVVRAYIDNASSPFNLSADNIIHLQGVGISGPVTSAMLSHDKKLSDQTAAMPPPLQPAAAPYANPYPYPNPATEAPPVEPVNTVSTYTIPADTSYYYSELAPYGNWSCLAGYGWCWQPSIGLGYPYYPWAILNYGRWWNCPGRGWVWFPRSGFRGSAGYFGGARGFAGGGRFGFGGNSFVANRSSVRVSRIGGGFTHSFGGFRGNNSVSVTHIGGGFHGGGGFAHSSGAFSGGHSFGGHSSGGFSGGHSFGGHSFGGGGHR